MAKTPDFSKAAAYNYDCFDIKHDIAFKMTFGSPDNSEILIAFLNDILSLEGQDRVVDLSLNATRPQVHDPGEKVVIYDICALDKSGREFIVEMQLRKEPNAETRFFYYGCMATASQLYETTDTAIANKSRKKEYGDVAKVIVIALLDYKAYTDNKYLSHYKLKDIYSDREMINANEYIFVELPKFPETDITKINSKIGMWLYLINNITTIKTLPEQFIDTVFAKVITVLNKYSMSIEKRSMILREIQRKAAKTAQDELEKQAVAEKSKAEGKAEGRAEGRAEGKAEGKATIITQMYRNGMSTTQIARITNDTVEAIESIVNGAIHE